MIPFITFKEVKYTGSGQERTVEYKDITVALDKIQSIRETQNENVTYMSMANGAHYMIQGTHDQIRDELISAVTTEI